MNKKEYLEKLEQGLGSMSYSDVKEILAEIDEHFGEGIMGGKTEEEICKGLGSPEELAKSYLEGTPLPSALIKAPVVNQNTNTSNVSTSGVLFVIFFNLLIALPVWASLLSVILSGVAAEIAMILILLAIIPACAALGSFMAVGILTALVVFFLTVLLTVILYFAIKYFVIGTVKYFKWNVQVWKKGL